MGWPEAFEAKVLNYINVAIAWKSHYKMNIRRKQIMKDGSKRKYFGEFPIFSIITKRLPYFVMQ